VLLARPISSFFQAYPLEDTRQHWGHAVSDDLVHWEDLPLAIYPGIESCCFSDSTLVEEGRVIAMYHGTSAGSMIAISNDPLLLNWEKISGCPVIPEIETDEDGRPYRVYDPCIWKEDGELLKLQVFIDKSVVEVFANHRQCLALRVYPEREDSTEVSIRVQGCDALLRSLEAWQMTCIWD